MGLCDWQCVTRGHWSRDLAYALSSTLDVEQRRSWEVELIQHYLDELAERTGSSPMEFEEAWLRYRQQLPGALFMWTPTLAVAHVVGRLRVPPMLFPLMQTWEISYESVRRIATAMSDLESLDSLDF
jgi:hypothetical protein